MSRGKRFLKHNELFAGALVGIALIVLAAWVIQSRIDTMARSSTSNVLNAVVDVTHQAIRSWVKEQTSEALIWAQHPNMRRIAAVFLATPADRESLAAASIQAEIRTWLNPVLSAKRYLGFFLIDGQGTTRASTRDANLATPNLLLAREGFLKDVWAGRPAVSAPQSSDVPLPNRNGDLVKGAATMFAAAPIPGENGDTIAILAFRIDPKTDFTAILRQARVGGSGETYAFDRKGRLISESRFESQLVEIGLMKSGPFTESVVELRDPGRSLVERETLPATDGAEERPLTRMARSAVAGGSGVDVSGYRDYRGVPVVGAWRWDDELGVGVASEIDVEEAFDAAESNKTTIFYSTAALIVMLLGMAIVLTGIREQRQKERSLTERSGLLGSILEDLSQGVVMFDRDRRLLAWNKQYLTVFPAFQGQLHVGKANWDMAYMLAEEGVFGDGDPRAITDARMAFLWGNESSRGDLFAEGDRIYDVIASRTAVGELVISYTDVTERRRAEGKVSEQRDELERLNQQKARLLSIISHDLRSPFTALIGFTDMLSRSSKDMDADQIAEICRAINEAGGRTLTLMENLLHWARCQMDETKVEPVPQILSELAEESIDPLRAVAEGKNIRLINESEDIEALCDPDMNNTVIRNLISNALKFTASNGEVKVSTRRLADHAEIAVADTGVGMDSKQLHRLIKLETQKRSPGTQGEPGTGLGLLICKDFVEKQGGKLFVMSETGRGSTFCFTLPLHDGPMIDAASPANIR